VPELRTHCRVASGASVPWVPLRLARRRLTDAGFAWEMVTLRRPCTAARVYAQGYGSGLPETERDMIWAAHERVTLTPVSADAGVGDVPITVLSPKVPASEVHPDACCPGGAFHRPGESLSAASLSRTLHR
jgi:hypothetical protein